MITTLYDYELIQNVILILRQNLPLACWNINFAQLEKGKLHER